MPEDLSEKKPEIISHPEQTGNLPVLERKPNEFQEQIISLIPTVGTIDLSEKQKEILYQSVKPEDIEIRPEGLIYLPWMEYVTRLRDAFGLGWAIVPQGMPKIQGNQIYWPFYLVIQGKLASFAIGEQTYYTNNAAMTYGDACEGAKSNALMRLCKGIGIGLELWKPTFYRAWRQQYGETYEAIVRGQKKILWRKKGTAPAEIEKEDNPEGAPPLEAPQISEKITIKQVNLLRVKFHQAKKSDDEFKAAFEIDHIADLAKDKMADALAWIG